MKVYFYEDFSVKICCFSSVVKRRSPSPQQSLESQANLDRSSHNQSNGDNTTDEDDCCDNDGCNMPPLNDVLDLLREYSEKMENCQQHHASLQDFINE